MAQLGGTFDATAVAPSAGRELLPAGKYAMHITKSEMRATNDGEGQYLWIEHEVLEGEHAGATVYNNLNLVNKNETAVKIANADLSAICHATGKMQVSDSEDLHFVPMLVTVKVRPGRTAPDGKEYGPQNEVGKYEALPAGGVTRPVQAAAAPAARQAVTTPAARPAVSAGAMNGAKAAPPWATARA